MAFTYFTSRTLRIFLRCLPDARLNQKQLTTVRRILNSSCGHWHSVYLCLVTLQCCNMAEGLNNHAKRKARTEDKDGTTWRLSSVVWLATFFFAWLFAVIKNNASTRSPIFRPCHRRQCSDYLKAFVAGYCGIIGTNIFHLGHWFFELQQVAREAAVIGSELFQYRKGNFSWH